MLVVAMRLKAGIACVELIMMLLVWHGDENEKQKKEWFRKNSGGGSESHAFIYLRPQLGSFSRLLSWQYSPAFLQFRLRNFHDVLY